LHTDVWNRPTDAAGPAILKREVFPRDIFSALWICCTHPRSAMRRFRAWCCTGRGTRRGP